MLTVELDDIRGIAILEPHGELSESDFISAAAIIDPYLESNDGLTGLVIAVQSFPGWDSLAALIAHLTFVRDHHQKLARIAFATDSALGTIAEQFASHFVSAEIKHFSYEELEESKHWVAEGKR